MRTRLNEAAGLSGADLLIELVGAVKEQIETDGSYRTPLGSAYRRSRLLTRRWGGKPIAAEVLGGGNSTITKRGNYVGGKDEDGKGELVEFDTALSEINTVSPAYGGYIDLTDGTCISLRAFGDNGELPEGYATGLELTIQK